jgi:hypothetical protein
MRILAPLLLIGLLASCTASPLYVERSQLRGTKGEIPRDARGEPLWAAIRPMPEGAIVPGRQAEPQSALASVSN